MAARALPALALAAAAALLPLAAPRGAAESATGIPDTLAEALQGVRDELDPAGGGDEAKRRKALDRALVRLAKPTTDLAGDLATLAAATKIVQKAFPGPGDVADLLDDAAYEAQGHVDSLLVEVYERSRTSDDPALREGADRFIGKGFTLVDRADESASGATRFKLLAKAAKQGKKGLAWLERQGIGPPPPPAVRMTATVGEYAFVDATATATWTVATGALSLRGLDSSTAKLRDLRITIPSGVTGPGTYSLKDGIARYKEGVTGPTFDSTSGSLVITTISAESRVLKGTFSFVAKDGGAERRIEGGVLDWPDLIVR